MYLKPAVNLKLVRKVIFTAQMIMIKPKSNESSSR